MRAFHSIRAPERGCTEVLSSSTVNRSRPASLASYISMSARASTSSARSCAPAKVTTPMLAVTRRLTPSSVRLFVAHRLDHHAGHPLGTLAVGGRQQDRELVAAEPGHEVGLAQRPAQHDRRRHDELVAGVVAAGVVDLLEVVEVEQQQGAAGPGAGAQVEVLGERRVEPAAVGQAGEHVVVGEVREPLLVAPPLGQVDDVDQDDLVRAVLGRDDPAGQRDVHLVEARAGHGPLPHDPRPGDQHRPVQVLGDLVAVVGGQVVEAAAHEGLDGAGR